MNECAVCETDIENEDARTCAECGDTICEQCTCQDDLERDVCPTCFLDQDWKD